RMTTTRPRSNASKERIPPASGAGRVPSWRSAGLALLRLGSGEADLRVVMAVHRAMKGIVLSNAAPGEARTWLLQTLAGVEHLGVDREVAEQALTLISELVADAVDHGSDAATIRVSVDDDSVCIELFDAPRRSIVAMTGREEGVPTTRRSIFRRLSDAWS